MSTRGRSTDELAARLGPVRDALLADAEAEAARIVAEARRAADDAVTTAIHAAEVEIEAAQRRGEMAALAHADLALARARNDAHAAVLRAREELRRELADRVHAAMEAVRGDSRYPALLDQLEVMAHSQLGSAAVIERDTDAHRGITAVAGDRRVDYTLRAVADRALDAIADEVAQLWT